ncbi:MAG: DNA starvation/stationary phase protection protein Dps [Chloroflexota bacterium]|nr:DNA starvation/stationary phase protection protein Dps [Chloroflexota bacterium]
MAKSAEATRTFKTHLDLPKATRTTVIALLNQQLADTFDLYSQIKQAHWNIKGKEFIALHELFDDLAERVLGFVDEIAERATALGGTAMGTARMAAANSTLPEYPADAIDAMAHVTALVDRYGKYAASTRAAIDTADEHQDMTTADLFTEISRTIDKDLWFLEAHLQG